MRLIFLHGPPACGKFTVGTELARLTGFELYHNHLVVDAVLQRHAFGTPGFVAERDTAWRQHLSRAVAAGTEGMIFTFNPENSVPQDFIDWLFGEYAGSLSALHSIELTAGESVLEERLEAASRRRYKKLSDRALYRRLREQGAFRTPVIPRTDLSLDTEQLDPLAAAQRIRAACGLP